MEEAGSDDSTWQGSVVETDFQRPDRSRSVTKIDAGEFTFEITHIAIGVNSYVQGLGEPKWLHSIDDSCNRRSDIINLPSLDESVLEPLALQGVEDMGGEAVFHLAGQLSLDAAFMLLGDADRFDDSVDDSALGSADVALWVGVEDFLVRQLTFSFGITLTYSNFGKPMDIQPPAPEQISSSSNVHQLLMDSSDDYGDGPLLYPGSLPVGSPREGRIESTSDRDVFVFNAVQGQDYAVEVLLCSLTDFSAGIVDMHGTELARNDREGDVPASRVLWRAPGTGSYYAFIESAAGSTGSYLLLVDATD